MNEPQSKQRSSTVLFLLNHWLPQQHFPNLALSKLRQPKTLMQVDTTEPLMLSGVDMDTVNDDGRQFTVRVQGCVWGADPSLLTVHFCSSPLPPIKKAELMSVERSYQRGVKGVLSGGRALRFEFCFCFC